MKILFLLVLVSLAFAVGGVTRANHEPYQLERIEMDPNPSPAVVEGHLKKLPGAALKWMYPGAKVNGLHESGPSQAYPKGNALISMRTPDSPERVREYYESYLKELRVKDVLAYDSSGGIAIVRFEGASLTACPIDGVTQIMITVGEFRQPQLSPPN